MFVVNWGRVRRRLVYYDRPPRAFSVRSATSCILVTCSSRQFPTNFLGYLTSLFYNRTCDPLLKLCLYACIWWQVLTLENGQERQTVLDTFNAFFSSISMPVTQPQSQSEYVIKQHAITKDKRQKLLDKFFSAVFAQVLLRSTLFVFPIFDHPQSGMVYNFGRVCLSVCMYLHVCRPMSDANFRKPWRKKFIFAYPVYL